jgi:hypothetical protein
VLEKGQALDALKLAVDKSQSFLVLPLRKTNDHREAKHTAIINHCPKRSFWIDLYSRRHRSAILMLC